MPLLDDDFVEFGASGAVWDEASDLAAMAGLASAEGDGIACADVRGVRLADDVVHVTYTAAWRGVVSGRSSVWRRTDGGWRLYFHQGTPLRLA